MATRKLQYFSSVDELELLRAKHRKLLTLYIVGTWSNTREEELKLERALQRTSKEIEAIESELALQRDHFKPEELRAMAVAWKAGKEVN